MAHEIEAAQLDAVTSVLRFRRKASHAAPPGTPCANCGVELQGPWCHACGQLGEDFHRSWIHLVGESLEGLLHMDGRLWRTLPDLALRPGRLTRAYLEGHRAPQIPPLRLFLVVLLLVFFASSLRDGGGGLFGSGHPHPRHAGQPEKLNAQLSKANVRVVTVDHGGQGFSDADRAKLKAEISKMQVGFGSRPDPGTSAWFRDRLDRVIDNPQAFKLIMESWSERFAFLMLPIAALILSVLFVFQRRFYLFDHLIFSMHSLSFQGLLLTAATLLPLLVGGRAGIVLLASPVHLFIHMRGVYGTGIPGTLARMAVLFLASLVSFCILMVGLMVVGLASL
ncbi:MAG TPA: DUF3667 domain-containing protein [Caulobacteraceae bacterium]|jgi:hypothetical protein